MFNIFISIAINVMLLLFDLNTFSWLHISQINTKMFPIFFKFTFKVEKLKGKKKKENMEIHENYEKRERVVRKEKWNIKYSNFEVSRQMFESLSSKNKNSFRAATQG